MSELQSALIIFGIILVIAVLVFNWIQENKYKNKKTLESNITDDPLFNDYRREAESSVDDKETELSSASFEAAYEKESLGEERVAETAETIPTLSFVESDDLYHKTEFLIELSIAKSCGFNEISDFTVQILTENPEIKLYLFDETHDQWMEAKNINNSPGRYRIGLPLINKSGRLEYEPENKSLAKFAEDALNNKTANYVLIIDEINRANLPSVLGELIYALEYRGDAVESMYAIEEDNKITIPPNLYIIGTMNTADRSVGHIDYAIRRRFAFVDVLPDEGVIANAKAKKLFEEVSKLFVESVDGKKKNSKYLTADFDYKDIQLGHSYFLLKEYKEDDNKDEKQLEV